MAIKQFAKNLLSNSVIPKFFSGKRFIFVYHDIAERMDNRYSPYYSVTQANFKSQVELLQEGFNLIDLETLVTKEDLGRGNFASIVFDDGFQSVKDVALPILEQKGIPMALFVNRTAIERNQLWVTNLEMAKGSNAYMEKVWKLLHDTSKVPFSEFKKDPVGISISKGHFLGNFDDLYVEQDDGEQIYLDKGGVKYLSGRGVLIGSHTCDHIVMSRTEEHALELQIEENKAFIEGITGKPVQHFAIPFGKKEHYDDKSITITRNAGHCYIYSTNPNCFEAKTLDAVNQLIPRVGVADTHPRTLSFYINRALLKKYDI